MLYQKLPLPRCDITFVPTTLRIKYPAYSQDVQIQQARYDLKNKKRNRFRTSKLLVVYSRAARQEAKSKLESPQSGVVR
jgi:protein subunit release factor B